MRYRTQASDTSLEVEAILIERYRGMGAVEKVLMMRELSRASQELALAGARLRHPEADADELRLRVASTRFPASTMLRVFGWNGDARHPR